MAAPPTVDSSSWGPIEWVVTGLTTTVTAVSGFVWGTRSKLADHDRRIELMENDYARDLRRLEAKLDGNHLEMTRMLMSLATMDRPKI
jgi:hypothetical protein